MEFGLKVMRVEFDGLSVVGDGSARLISSQVEFGNVMVGIGIGFIDLKATGEAGVGSLIVTGIEVQDSQECP